MLFCSGLLAQDARQNMWLKRPLNQNIIRTWPVNSILSRITILDIAQDKTGFIWLATNEGIVRFDGVHTKVYDLENTPAFKNQDMEQVEVTSDGVVWASNRQGLFYLEDGVFKTWVAEYFQLTFVEKIVSMGNGEILVLANDRLYLVNGRNIIESPFGIETATFIKKGLNEKVWIVLNDGRVRYIQEDKLHIPQDIERGISDPIRRIVEDVAGNLYIITWDQRTLFYNQTEFVELDFAKRSNSSGPFKDLYSDSHGYVWGATSFGVFRFNRDSIEKLTTDNGLANNRIIPVFEDSQGDIWIGTFKGLNYIRKSPISLIRVEKDNKPFPLESRSVLEDSQGRIWVGSNEDGLFLYQDGRLVKPQSDFQIPDNAFTLSECTNGDLLIGGREGLIRVKYVSGTLRYIEKMSDKNIRFTYAGRDGTIWWNTLELPESYSLFRHQNGREEPVKEFSGKRIRWMSELQNGETLLGTERGFFKIDGETVKEIGANEGLSSEAISSFWQRDESLWAVAQGNALISLKSDTTSVSIHNARNGFSIKSPTAIAMDDNNGVWISSLSGLYRISQSELNRNTKDQDSLNHTEYYPVDIAVDQVGFPINWKAKDGRIYYTSPMGLVVVNEEYRGNRARNYQIESVTVDGVEQNLLSGIELKPTSNKVAIEFSTIDFANTGDLMFEYQLEGFDTKWYKVGGAREIYYTNLPSGDFNFRLREVNSEGYYEDAGQTIAITKPKYWYETNVAITTYFILIAGAVSLASRTRTRSVRQQNERLNDLVKSRTIELEEVLANLEEKIKKRTASLTKANEQLNLAMDAGRHAVFRWYVNEDGQRVADYSDRYFLLLGYEPQSFETNWETFLQRVHPDDREFLDSTIQNLLENQAGDNPNLRFNIEFRIRKKDGSYIWIESNGKIAGSSLTGMITDISERKSAEMEREASEERFRKVFDASTNAMMLVSFDGSIIMQNYKAEKLFEYAAEEWTNLKVGELVPDSLSEGQLKLGEDFKGHGKLGTISIERDLNALTKTGKLLPVQIGLSPVRIKEDSYILVVIVDMTERVKMEQDLEAHRRQLQIERDRYAGVFQNMNDALFVMDVEEDGRFRFVEFNKAEEEITGLKSNEIAGKYIHEVFPDFSDYLEWRFSTCRDTMQVITYNEQLKFITGFKDFKTSLVPVVEGGKVVRIIGIAHDITDLIASEKIIKDKEEKLRYALQASQDAIVDWNLENETMEFSEALYRMLGYRRGEIREDLDGMIGIANNSDTQNTTTDKMISIVNSLPADTQFTSEFRMKRKSGEWLWVLLKGKVVERNEHGKAMRFVGTLTDISSEKQKTKEQLETILKTEDNERSRISREIHDGLQQTLTISALNMEFAKKEIDKLSVRARSKFETGWDYLQKSIAESRTVAHSLMPKAIVDFGLVSACSSLIMQYNDSIEHVNFQFQENLGEERIPDKNVELTLYRILQEALNNIVKYAEASQVSVQLRSYEDIFMLTIEDNGVGFDMANVQARGTGFGLMSMQNRIDAISGHLEIDSAPGRGTVVIVEINKDALA